MNAITDLFSSPWIQALGWTLLHSLWQSLLCVMVVIMVLRCIPSRVSNIRYAVATGGLLLIFLVSTGTFLHLNTTAFSITGETEKSLHQTISIPTNAYEYQSFRGLFIEIKSLIQSNIAFIVFIWSVGALLFSLRVFGGWWYTRKLRGNAIEIENEWSQRLQKLAAHLGINQIISLAESSHIEGPVVIGYIKPMILIPIGMCSGLSVEQLESIFIHELIHIRRGDYFVNMIQSFLEALFFFNPFVWILSGIMRREREHCCDDAVVKVYGNALAYAHALATLEEVRLSRSGLALSLAENKNQLLNRIKRIMEKSVKSYSGRERIVPVALLVIGLICASWLTIQSGKSEKDLVSQSNPVNEQTVVSDTTIKEKSARYSKKKVTTIGEDGNPEEEIVEEVEGDEELLLGLNFGIPPIPPVPNIDIAIPSVSIRDMYDMNMNIAVPPVHALPYLNFPFSAQFKIPAQFKMDTIPLPKHWGDRDWEEFGREFEKNFKERFGDFYEKHDEELKSMMQEMEHKFGHQFDEEWDLKMENLAFKQEELARMQAEKLELHSKDNWEQHEEQMKRLEKDMKHWEEENAFHFEELEKNMRAMEENMKIFEKELRVQLIKDGYIGADEKINSIQVTDENIEINGKRINASDQKKYKELFEKNTYGPKDVRKKFSGVPDGRKE